MEFNEFKDRAYFYQFVHKGPYPNEAEETMLYRCFCKLYNPSMKDREVLKTTTSNTGVTLIMRSPYSEYLPKTNHFVKLDKEIYASKVFNIIEVRQNTPYLGYDTVVLSEK
ncbi:TPA: hypothetical protein RUU96_002559 [Staphylococcus aureus]|nr:hypothetical protein [Staphylococcus aureus]HDZ8697864.1 hypothetical protein [Staphylococcus aureus]